jgi:hypothetical protein
LDTGAKAIPDGVGPPVLSFKATRFSVKLRDKDDTLWMDFAGIFNSIREISHLDAYHRAV